MPTNHFSLLHLYWLGELKAANDNTPPTEDAAAALKVAA